MIYDLSFKNHFESAEITSVPSEKNRLLLFIVDSLTMCTIL